MHPGLYKGPRCNRILVIGGLNIKILVIGGLNIKILVIGGLNIKILVIGGLNIKILVIGGLNIINTIEVKYQQGEARKTIIQLVIVICKYDYVRLKL